MSDATRAPSPEAIDMEQFHGNQRLSIFSKIQSLPPSLNATPLLVTAGTVGELVGLICNGDSRLIKDCLAEMQKACDRTTRLDAMAQLARVQALQDQIAVLTGRHKRERKLIKVGKDALAKLPPRR